MVVGGDVGGGMRMIGIGSGRDERGKKGLMMMLGVCTCEL